MKIIFKMKPIIISLISLLCTIDSILTVEDEYFEKVSANDHLGLLEKAQKLLKFHTLSEARHYQAQYGGSINMLNKYGELLQRPFPTSLTKQIP